MSIAKHERLEDYPESERYRQILAGRTLNSARANEVANKSRNVIGRTFGRRKTDETSGTS